VKEALTDKEGKVRISDVSKLFAQPHVTVYKKGYVAWNNQFIFPDYKKRTNFKWQNNLLIKLQLFKKEYSYIDHQAFIDGAAHVGLSPSKKQLFLKIYNEGERESVIKERQKSMN
jgi:hypothetical protein